jgi:hypothetical protein
MKRVLSSIRVERGVDGFHDLFLHLHSARFVGLQDLAQNGNAVIACNMEKEPALLQARVL